jgi:hypothetical protein
MTKREVASLALKLLGIYAFILAISSFHSMMISLAIGAQYTGTTSHDSTFFLLAAGSGIPLLLLIFLGWYLIAASERLSKGLFPQEVGEDKISALSSEDAQTIAFSVVGLLLLTKAVPNLFRVMLRISSALQYKTLSATVIKTGIIQSSVVVVVQLALGLYLFLGSKGLSGLWHKLQRTRGM